MLKFGAAGLKKSISRAMPGRSVPRPLASAVGWVIVCGCAPHPAPATNAPEKDGSGGGVVAKDADADLGSATVSDLSAKPDTDLASSELPIAADIDCSGKIKMDANASLCCVGEPPSGCCCDGDLPGEMGCQDGQWRCLSGSLFAPELCGIEKCGMPCTLPCPASWGDSFDAYLPDSDAVAPTVDVTATADAPADGADAAQDSVKDTAEDAPDDGNQSVADCAGALAIDAAGQLCCKEPMPSGCCCSGDVPGELACVDGAWKCASGNYFPAELCGFQPCFPCNLPCVDAKGGQAE